MSAGKAYKGRFSPKHPSKYKGDPTNIIYRSSWELEMMKWLDDKPFVLEWQSEEFFIPYISPLDNKPHRYFPDFFARIQDGDGSIKTFVIEVKPLKETVEPKFQKKKTRKYITEVLTWGKNDAKWKAAREYCADRGWEFKIFTEIDIFGDGLRKRKNK